MGCHWWVFVWVIRPSDPHGWLEEEALHGLLAPQDNQPQQPDTRNILFPVPSSFSQHTAAVFFCLFACLFLYHCIGIGDGQLSLPLECGTDQPFDRRFDALSGDGIGKKESGIGVIRGRLQDRRGGM